MSFAEKIKRSIARRLFRYVKYWAVDVDKTVPAIVARHRAQGVTIGENVALYDCDLDPVYPDLISIGDNVTITHSAILTHDDSTLAFLKRRRIAPVRIGNNVFIGWQSIVLPGVTIGDNCIIGAGSVVVKDIPSNSVAAGNPARVIRAIDEHLTKMLADPNLIASDFASNIPTDEEHAKAKALALESLRKSDPS